MGGINSLLGIISDLHPIIFILLYKLISRYQQEYCLRIICYYGLQVELKPHKITCLTIDVIFLVIFPKFVCLIIQRYLMENSAESIYTIILGDDPSK